MNMKAVILGALLGSATLSASLRPAAPGRSIEIEGLIEPYVTVHLSSSVDGLIESVHVERGDSVEAGQVIARLESSVETLSRDLARQRASSDAQIRSARARLELQRRTRERNEKLVGENIVSQGDLDVSLANEALAEAELVTAQENKLLAELELKRAEANLELRTIRSPVQGVVMDRFLSPGELMNRTSQLEIVRIAQLDPLLVEVLAPIEVFGKVRVGMQAEVLPEAPIGGSYRARVTVVDPVIDAASATFGIRLELPNPERRLPAGIKCSVRLVD